MPDRTATTPANTRPAETRPKNRAAISMPITGIDSYGESEEILGRSLKNAGVERESVVLATKVRGAMSEAAFSGEGDVNNVGLSRQHIMAACDASLRRLGTDYIDLYQVHAWDPSTPIEETLRTLNDLVRMGKVRYIGCSNWTARHIMKSLEICRAHDWETFASLQAYYSLVGRDLEHELLPLTREEGLGVLTWSPLSGGFSRASTPVTTRVRKVRGASTSTSRRWTTAALTLWTPCRRSPSQRAPRSHRSPWPGSSISGE